MNLFLIIAIVVSIIILIVCAYFSRREDIVVHEDEIKLYGITSGLLKNLKTYEYDEVPTFRELPFKGSYFLAAYISSMYGMSQSDNVNILFLSWIKNDIIRIIREKDKMVKIELIKEPQDELEKQFYVMMQHAAEDNILDMDEFKYYCKENYKKIKNWLGNIQCKKSIEILSNKEYVKMSRKSKGLLNPSYEFTATEELNKVALKLAGLKKFLHEFTLINEKQPIEVKMWRDYLIYAEIFGMGYKVQEVFKKYYGINVQEFISVKELEEKLTSVVLTSFTAGDISERLTNLTITNGSFLTSDNFRDFFSGFSSGGGGSFGGGGGGGGFR